MKNRAMLVILLIFLGGGLYLFFGKSTNVSPTTKECSGNPTPQQAEGPYYKIGSPQTNNIAQGTIGKKLTVMGFVFDKNCQPIANAKLDFWHADAGGNYDNDGYTLRGHIFTDESGKYTVKTIVPAAYETRPPHIHVKVQAGTEPILTSQLYFPNAAQNQTDSIFNKDLIMEISEGDRIKIGKFNFILQ